MRFRDFVRETRFRTLGLNGMRLVGKTLLVPAEELSTHEWEAKHGDSSSPEVALDLEHEERLLIRR